MFFLLSKVLLIIFSPTAWLFMLLVAAIIARRGGYWRARWLWTATVLLFIGGNNALVNLSLRAWEMPAVPMAAVAPADAAVLLTGITAASDNGNDRVHLSRGADRVTNALWLYRAGRVRRIIISGGSGSIDPSVTTTEADELATLLRLAGVPQRDLLLEKRSRNTRENALYTKELLTHYPDIQKLILVTSAFHERRAMGCFAKVGLQPKAFPADSRNVGLRSNLSFWLLPDVEALGNLSVLLHEMAGYFIYRIMGYC